MTRTLQICAFMVQKKQISQQLNVLLPPSVEVSSTTWRRNGKKHEEDLLSFCTSTNAKYSFWIFDILVW